MILPTDLFAFETLWRHYRICRRNKRNTINQLRFEVDASRALHLVRVGIARGGFAFSVGLPVRLSGAYIARAIRAGYAVVEVREVDRLSRSCAARQVVAVWIPAEKIP